MIRVYINSKKGATPAVVGIILGGLILLLLIYSVVIGSRECSSDKDCPNYYYCGSDFSCHEHQIVEKKVQDLIIPAAILGVSIIVAAIILRIKIDERNN